MANVSVYNMEGKEVGSLELNDAVFGVEVNEHLVHMAVVQQLANNRQGTQKAKTRSEVRGGGRKPWRQKGTGRARQGSTRSAQWTGGGVVFAPTPRDYSFKLNKKEKRAALKAVLTTKVVDQRFIVLDQLQMDSIKTKNFQVMLDNLKIDNALIVLNSKDQNFPNGVANNSGNVGKNFLSRSGGIVSDTFDESNLPLKDLLASGLFVNRSIMDWYYSEKFKGGTIDILFEHANPIRRASNLRWNEDELIIGEQLQNRIFENFTKTRRLNIEIFTDWTPNDNSFISVDEKYKDKYAIPVANIRIGTNPQDLKASKFLEEKAIKLFEQMGAKDIKSEISQLPSGNLQAGGCRFGNNPKTSVLNKYCQAHEVSNLFVTDGSFMPTGGSVPFTWTIYANSFRVADYIKDNFENIIN